MIKVLGAFTCPCCFKPNLCNCPTCSKFYNENGVGDYKFVTWVHDGNAMLCAYCNEIFSPDASMEAEFQLYGQNREPIPPNESLDKNNINQ